VLLRLAYLAVSSAFAVLRLLPLTDREKDTEILVLRHPAEHGVRKWARSAGHGGMPRRSRACRL